MEMVRGGGKGTRDEGSEKGGVRERGEGGEVARDGERRGEGIERNAEGGWREWRI